MNRGFKLSIETKIAIGFIVTFSVILIFSMYTFMQIEDLASATKDHQQNQPILISFLILILITLVVLATVYYFLRRDIQWRRKTKANLREANSSLENRIQLRTDALIKNEKKYRILTESMLDVISLHNLDGTYSYISESCEALTGFGVNELIGRSGYDFIHADDLSYIQQVHVSLFTADPYSGAIPFRFIRKDGTFIWVESVVKILNDANGNYENILVCTRDISERKKTDDLLIESKIRLSGLLQSSADPICSINEDFMLVDFNIAAEKMAKQFYGTSLTKGMKVWDLFDQRTVGNWEDNFKKAFSGIYFTYELPIAHKSDEYYFDVAFNPIKINGQIKEVAVFFKDITLRKRTEKQLQYKINELNTFMYKATHDLRSPLVSLIGLVQLANEENKESEALTQYFEMIEKSVSKMDKLLIDLVTITNVSQGQKIVSEVKFGQMIEQILESLSHIPDFEKIVFRKKIEQDKFFYNNDKLLYSVLQNLIDNAIKYRNSSDRRESVIIITVNCNEGQMASINVTDNGIGIPQKSIDKVFDMFYRATSSSSGTGLGLYIVKNSVEKMGGAISITSKEMEGTSVHLSIPNLPAPSS